MYPLAATTFALLLIFSGLEAAVRYIDLSHNYDESTIVWPGEEKYKMTVQHNGTVVGGGYWYQSEKFSTATHGGTHLDAPCHFSKGTWSVEQIPIDRLITSAAVVDVSRKTFDNPDYEVTIKDLQEWESQHGKIPYGAVLLINTGRARFWPDKKKYLGTDTGNTSLLHFPGVSFKAAQWIATERNISGLGMDVPSVDSGQSIGRVLTHRILSAENIFFLENVGEMRELKPTGVMLYALPMKLKGASAAPCRIVAVISDDAGCNAATKSMSHSFHLTIAVIILYCLKDRYRNVP